MPYASDAQRGYMHVHHPRIAARWDAEIHHKKRKRARIKAVKRRAHR